MTDQVPTGTSDALKELAGRLAHDVNNLLTSVSGSIEMIAFRLARGRYADMEKYVGSGQEAIRRGVAFMHRLQTYSRREAPSPRPTDIAALADALPDTLREQVGTEVEIRVVKVGDLRAAMIDPSQLEEALAELCLNARDAMPEGGAITIRMEMPDGGLVLSVADTGAGMAAETVARALDPLFTTKPAGEAPGLGLTMVDDFVRASGGQMRIDSTPGEGTVVSMTLPA